MAHDVDEMHDLEFAAWLHDIGLLMLPPHLVESRDSPEPEYYVAIQNHSRLGATLLELCSFFRERRSSSPITTSAGIGQGIFMASEASSSRSKPIRHRLLLIPGEPVRTRNVPTVHCAHNSPHQEVFSDARQRSRIFFYRNFWGRGTPTWHR